MQNKILIFLIAIGVAFIFCGTASATTTQPNHLNNVKTVKLTTSNQFSPAIDGNITWVQADSKGFSIYYKNLATGYKTKIYSSKQFINNLDISGTRVVWEQYDSNNKSSIYYKNVATGASGKVMPSSLNQNNAKISGTRIVWVQEMASGQGAIYERNLASNFIGKLYASPYDQASPNISGTNVVWQQTLSSGQSLVYMKNLLKGHPTKISTTTSFQVFPDISGSRIVWTQIDDSGVVTLQKFSNRIYIKTYNNYKYYIYGINRWYTSSMDGYRLY